MARAKIQPNDGQPLTLSGAFIRRTNLDGANLSHANLSEADLSGASARRANFSHARMTKTVLRGTDLTDAQNLTIEQLAEAVIDQDTKLPSYIDRAALEK